MYYSVIKDAKKIFMAKLEDYGTSWKFFRPIGLTDQIFIKASRIQKIEETHNASIDEPIEIELKGIINYGIIALILLEQNENISEKNVSELYDNIVDKVFNLMLLKNSDYDNAWQSMDKRSFTDIILVRCARLKKLIMKNDLGKIKDQFIDIVNYAVFYLIKANFLENS